MFAVHDNRNGPKSRRRSPTRIGPPQPKPLCARSRTPTTCSCRPSFSSWIRALRRSSSPGGSTARRGSRGAARRTTWTASRPGCSMGASTTPFIIGRTRCSCSGRRSAGGGRRTPRRSAISPAWFERVEQYRRGVEARPSNERAVSAAGGGRRVLVVGASAMGNVGDDLLAGVLTEMLAAEGADVHLAGPDIDPLRVAAYDAVVVGGGGLVYASRNGHNETQNVANYLKFGPIARRCGVPAALIGVGDQDHAGGVERNPLTKRFVAAALAQFDHVTARDAQSGDFLARHGAAGPKVGSDLLFRWRERARGAVKPTAVQPGRVAFAGELFRFRAIADGFAKGGALAACAEDADIDVLVMSDDDVQHAQRMQQVLTKAGASAAVVDLRNRDFAALVFLFASYSAVVTTRFHGLVIAALAEVPVLALDVAGRQVRAPAAQRRAPRARWSSTAQPTAFAGSKRRSRVSSSRCRPRRSTSSRGKRPCTSKRCSALLGSRDEAGTRIAGAAAPARSGPPRRGRHRIAIPLCWAASSAETKGFAQSRRFLSAVMVAALSGRRVRHTSFDDAATKLVAVGSIGHAIKRGTAVVWGSGVSIRGGVLAQSVPQTRYDVRAMRGRISAQHYRDFGIPVPDVYGDPVWLLPSIVHEPVEKKYELGVIPHIQDVADHHPDAPARADSLRYFVDAARRARRSGHQHVARADVGRAARQDQLDSLLQAHRLAKLPRRRDRRGLRHSRA